MRLAKTFVAFAFVSGVFGAAAAMATPALVVDADTGQVLMANEATANWYPASLTKLMTTYVALSAVREGRLTLDTPMAMSLRAARMPPSKMGFRPGVEVTLDNALKMLMVKSPNDVAVLVAEGVSGSVEAFADEMNSRAAQLGMRESHFVNPNGLPDARQVSSARDMAIVARALIKEFPDESDLFNIAALDLNGQIIPTHNGLIGHYPGADGMKTGFTCAAGFNIVASATHGGRRLITVVMGEPSVRDRNAHAVALFDRGFSQWGGGVGALESLPSPGLNSAPDMRQDVCMRRGKGSTWTGGEDDDFGAPVTEAAGRGVPMRSGSMYNAVATPAGPKFLPSSQYSMLTTAERPDPVPVFIGPKPGWTGPVLAARLPEPIKTLVAAPAPAALPVSATPPDATAYAPEKPDDKAAPGAGPMSAPMALQGALRDAGKLPAGANASERGHRKSVVAATPPAKTGRPDPAAKSSQPAL